MIFTPLPEHILSKLKVLFLALMSSGLDHTAIVGLLSFACFWWAHAALFAVGLGCHSLPIAAGRLAGAAHVPRAHRVCLACNSGAVGEEMHLPFECTALASLLSQYASLFTGSTDTGGTMR
ncbi:TPA: hypothetical protein ACH3X1_006263 [Trebouxia sp. C0004]